MKKCTKCNIEKEVTEFYKDKQKRDGLSSSCKVCMKIQNKKSYRKNIETRIIWNEKNREKAKKYAKEYRDKMKNDENYYIKERQRKKKYHDQPHVKEHKLNYVKERYKNDPIFKLKQLIRRRLLHVIKGSNRESSSKYIGCTWEELKVYIESQFTEGMTWDNHGKFGWHLDHIIPLASAKTEEEVYKLNHYTNLQPLWWEDNLKKSDKIFDFSEIE